MAINVDYVSFVWNIREGDTSLGEHKPLVCDEISPLVDIEEVDGD